MPSVRLVALFLAVGLYLVGHLVMAYYATRPGSLKKDLREDLSRGRAGDYYLAGIPAMLCASFVASCALLYRQWGESAFTNGAVSLGGWYLYRLDTVVGLLPLDFAETFRLSLSETQHARGLAMAVFVYSFRLLCGLAFLRVILEAWATLRHGESGTA